ncbi:MAG: YfhO family protein [Flavitalea sp.]
MKHSLWQRLTPHVIAIAIFFVVSVIYCFPSLQGMVVEQHDVQGWKGMAQQSFEYKEKYGTFPLWTNSLFSGMPATQIALESQYNITIAWLHHLFTLFLPQPASLFFLACIGFYVLCVTLRLKNWIGIFSSLGYAFASYNAIITAVGHTTKFASMGYTPAVLAGLILLANRKYWLGFIVTLIFSTLMFYQNHVQIVYYSLLIAICLGVSFAIRAFKEKDMLHFGKTVGLALVASVMGVLSYAVMLLPTYDYSKETMRGGKSELTIGQEEGNKTAGGLDKDYAFNWSYGIAETITGLVPRAFGGSSGTVVNGESVSEFGDDTKTSEILAERTGMQEEQADSYAKSFPAYWGPQPNTSGPVYFGAVVLVAFLFGLVFYKGWHKGWIIAATILGILMAWGKNFSGFNYFLFDYLPLYNKFRAPSMSLVIPQLTIPLLAGLGLQALFYADEKIESFDKKLKNSLIGIGALALIAVAMYFMLDYTSDKDAMLKEGLSSQMLQSVAQGQQPTPQMQTQANEFASGVVTSLKADRRSLYGSDLLRSLIFMAIAVALIYFTIRKKITANVAIIALSVVSFIDLIGIDLRYLSKRNYVPEEQLLSIFNPTPADLEIKRDTGYFRIYDQTDQQNGPYMSSRASYHHNSVGGYHPAKLALYDDLIKQQLSKGNMQVFNMLNTKYFIGVNPQNGQAMVQPNPEALGPVWFVKTIKYVNSADEEMKALDSFNARDTAIMDKREQSKVTAQPGFDSAATIRLVENRNDYINYESRSGSNQFAVFSEIYYPNGWKAFLDEKEVPIAKVNYVLRGLSVPAGNHKIEFRFEPAAYKTGNMISLIIGIISILLVAYGAYREYKIYKAGGELK